MAHWPGRRHHPGAGIPEDAPAGDDAMSEVSYPETPRFSDVASTVNTEVLDRLSKLEQQLVEVGGWPSLGAPLPSPGLSWGPSFQERMRREAVEQEMERLLSQTRKLTVGGSAGTAAAGGSSSKPVSRPGTGAGRGSGGAAAQPIKSVKFTAATSGRAGPANPGSSGARPPMGILGSAAPSAPPKSK